MIKKLVHKVKNKIGLKKISSEIENTNSYCRESKSLQEINLLVDEKTYIPWTTSSLSPSTISLVLNDIVINDRRKIVELGSGVSTIYTSMLLKSMNSKKKKLYSIDHNKDWSEKMKKIIKRNDCKEFVEIIHAPLEKTDLAYQQAKWYSEKVIREQLKDEELDQILVDGPPAYKKEVKFSRYPALPFFEDRLNHECCILLDDIDREAERRITKMWESQFKIEFDNIGSRGGVAMGIRGKSYNLI